MMLRFCCLQVTQPEGDLSPYWPMSSARRELLVTHAMPCDNQLVTRIKQAALETSPMEARKL